MKLKVLILYFLVFAVSACKPTAKKQEPTNIKRFFAEDSFWNQPLENNPEIDPQNDQYIGLLKKDHSRKNFGINLNRYTIPIYEVDSSVPLIKVGNHPDFNFRHHPDFDKMGVPIPKIFKKVATG